MLQLWLVHGRERQLNPALRSLLDMHWKLPKARDCAKALGTTGMVRELGNIGYQRYIGL
jgi:hypothetical protein